LSPELTEQDLVADIGLLGVRFQASALEVLHRVRPAIGQHLLERVAERVAVDRQIAVP